MGLVTKEKLDELIAAGCACGSKRLTFSTYVDARLPLMQGEPVGKLTWAYDGEAFCDGIYEVRCATCAASLFSSDVCPRCHAEGGLEKALNAENAYDVPEACGRCQRQEITYFAMVPATTAYESVRAEKARTDTAILDPGFHGYKATCKDCGTFAELRSRCMLCDAPAPLRSRA
jgi:hypothetical protein